MYPFISVLGRKIPLYGICMFFGIALVLFLASRRVKKNNIVFEDLLIVGGFALLFAIPFGTLTYAFVTFGFKRVFENIVNGNFAVLGGLVFYGALIGGILGGLIGIKVAKVKIISVEKSVVPFIPIGHAIGRIGCVMAGCCYGMEYDGPLAIHYTNAITGVDPTQGYFPVQLLEGFLNIFVSLILILIANKCTKRFQLLASYLLMYGVVRFTMEFFRGDDIRGIYFALSTSQWISIILSFISLSVILLTSSRFKRNKKG